MKEGVADQEEEEEEEEEEEGEDEQEEEEEEARRRRRRILTPASPIPCPSPITVIGRGRVLGRNITNHIKAYKIQVKRDVKYHKPYSLAVL